MRLRAALGALLLLVVFAPRPAPGQERGATALDQLLRGLTVTSRVLMVAAHPDDEDTNLLAGLVRGHQVHAAYLSLTRGDGGQNLIGNELNDALGAIRTEELLAARRVDGAQQFFSRAYDFGFSKTAEETFTHWDKEALLGDVVRVIRAFRPHVVVAVFTGTSADGHGHHQASGILAREAFEVAMDTVRFPVATHGRPWEPQKFYRSARGRGPRPTLAMEVGRYDAVLGRTPAEIAGESRSQHRSQGFGTVQRRGAVQARVARELTRVNANAPADDETSIFDGVDTTFTRLARIAGGRGAALAAIPALAKAARDDVDLRRPATIVPTLARIVVLAESARDSAKLCRIVPIASDPSRVGAPAACDAEDIELDESVERILVRSRAALMQAAGVLIEVTAPTELLAFGDATAATMHVYNRGTHALRIDGVRVSGMRPEESPAPVFVAAGTDTLLRVQVIGLPDHRPWWVGERRAAMFRDQTSPSDGVARVAEGAAPGIVPGVSVAEDTRRTTDVRVRLEIAGVTTVVDGGSIVHRFADPVLGEQNRPLGGVPPITVTLDRTLEYVRAGVPLDRRLRVTLQSHTETPRVLRFRAHIPDGVQARGLPDSLVLDPGATQELFVTLTGQLAEGRHDFGIGAESDGTVHSEGFSTIEYPHIRPIRLYRQSAAYLLAVAVKVPRALRVAYVTGVSDAVAPVLGQLGIPTTTLSPDQVPLLDLSLYTTIVIGPRAYGTSAALRASNPRLFEWVRNGGTLVVQYGQFEMQQPGMTPHPIGFTRPAARVALEDAPVTLLDAQSRLLRWPNSITERDWADWVQERALYIPTTIDERYHTPLSMHDPGEPPRTGALLDLPLGRGRYVYTSLALFRQIPGGVPGGVRILVNLLSAGLSAEQ